jgi:hypothetical protein
MPEELAIFRVSENGITAMQTNKTFYISNITIGLPVASCSIFGYVWFIPSD